MFATCACCFLGLLTYIISYILVVRRRLRNRKGANEKPIIHGYYLVSIISQALFARCSLVWLPLYLLNQVRMDIGITNFFSEVCNSLHSLFNRIVPAECILIIVMGSFDSIQSSTRFRSYTWVACAVYTIVAYAVLSISVFFRCFPEDNSDTDNVSLMSAASAENIYLLGAQEVLVLLPYVASIIGLIKVYSNSDFLRQLEEAVGLVERNVGPGEAKSGFSRRQLDVMMVTRCIPAGLMFLWNVSWMLFEVFLSNPPGGSLDRKVVKDVMWMINSVLVMICEMCNSLTFVIR